MLIILVDTFHHLSSSHPYTEPLEYYSVQISQPVSNLFVIIILLVYSKREKAHDLEVT